MGVVAYRPAIPGPWWWRLVGNRTEPAANTQQPGNLGNLGNLAENKVNAHTPQANIAKIPQAEFFPGGAKPSVGADGWGPNES